MLPTYWQKFDHAWEQFETVHRIYDEWASQNPLALRERRERVSESLVIDRYLAEIHHPAPPKLLLALGDTVHALRSSLDLLVYELSIPPGQAEPESKTEFPIFDDSAKYAATKKDGTPAPSSGLGKIQALDASAQSRIESVQPYNGGPARSLWYLHELDVIDKHRTILVGVSAIRTVHTLASMPSDSAALGRIVEDDSALIIDLPLRTGSVVAAVAYHNGAEQDPRMRASVAVGHDLVIETSDGYGPLLETIAMMFGYSLIEVLIPLGEPRKDDPLWKSSVPPGE